MKPLPPKPPRFSIPVSGARIGSLARPVADGVVEPAPKRFGLRAHASALGAPQVPPKDEVA